MNRLVSLILILLAGLKLNSQDIKVSVESPGVVGVGEQFMVTWVINSRGGEFNPPAFNDFYKLMGPQTSFSSSTQIINGKVTSEIRNSYSYYLQATREGKFTLGAATYTEGRRDYTSEPFEIEVVATGQGQARTNARAGDAGAVQAETGNGNDLYIRLLVNRNRVYMGEHVVATLKLYSKINLSGIQEYRFPDFNSFLKEDIETPQVRNLERENVDGEIYGTAVLQRFLLYPQRSGTIEIDPATLTVLVQERLKSNDPFFGDFFSSFNTIPKILSTQPVKIEVIPLPPGEPPGFSGTVGNINARSETDKDTLSVNDALTYTIILSGNGNLRLAAAPEISISPDIEIYEPRTISDLRTSTSGAEGTVKFEYILIPRYHGNFKIPSFSFSYFDPDSRKYRTVETGARDFYVIKSGNEEQGNEVYGGTSREDVTYLGRDIRYIDTTVPLFKNSSRILVSGSALYILFASVFAIFWIIIILRREQVKRNSDLAKVRNRKAGRIARNRLKTAARYMKDNDHHRFYSELLGGIWGYLGDKLDIPVSKFNREFAMKTLLEKGMDTALVEMAGDLIDKCEYSRYAPVEDEMSPQEVYELAVKVIREIENNI